MRGKHPVYITCLINVGITPADAGKTLVRATYATFDEDHPRGCGENRHFDAGFAVKIGSPPRMRGKLLGNWVIAEGLGITPADAGKTCRLCF